MAKIDIAQLIQQNKPLTTKEKVEVVFRLSLPAILAQITEIVMQYIDAAMVGSLGANAAASIGLVASSTWLFGGIISSVAAGFSVQVAHAIGADEKVKANSIFRQSIVSALSISFIIMIGGILLSFVLPQLLNADPSIWNDSSAYFRYYSLFIPARMMMTLSMQMLQCTGNMKIPAIAISLSCFLDIIFNYFFIFPTREISLFSSSFPSYGLGLGVLGAQLGTSCSILVAGLMVFGYALFRSDALCLSFQRGNWKPQKDILGRALQIGGPMFLQQGGHSLAQVISTGIVAPLGNIAIAANSFAVTVESICYMPGFGIGSASTTLVGQSVGAKKKELAKSFAWLSTLLGVIIMTLTGALMYFLCPYVFAMLTPVEEVRILGAEVLRIELLIEPFFAAGIVATAALRGAGDTFVPGIINIASMWGVRLTLAMLLTPFFGLRGVWIAMAIDNTVAGLLLLIRLYKGKWLKKII